MRPKVYVDPPMTITPRQQQILELIAEGGMAKEMGPKLGLSPRTVEQLRGDMVERMGAKTIAHLVAIAMRQGLIK